MEQKTEFKELSWPCKIGIVGGWVTLIFYTLALIAGFISGIMQVMAK